MVERYYQLKRQAFDFHDFHKNTDAYLEVFKRLTRCFASLQQRCVQSWHLVRMLPILRGPWLKKKIILIDLPIPLNSNIIPTMCYAKLNFLFSQGFLTVQSVNGGIPLIPQTQKQSRRDLGKIYRGGAQCSSCAAGSDS